jgi:alpha-amylase
MKGEQRHMGNTDGNDIPIREAFDWYAAGGKGMAHWYKDTGEWWTNRNEKPNDGISYEEQKADPNSLWNWYKNLLALRNDSPTLKFGRYETAENTNDNVLSFYRIGLPAQYLVLINLSGVSQTTSTKFIAKKKQIFGSAPFQAEKGILTVTLQPYETTIFRINY